MGEPQGIEPVAVNDAGRKAPRPARPWLELLLCVIGSFGSVFFPALGCAAMVYGSWLLGRPEERRAVWAVAGCLLPGVVLSFVSWDIGSLALPIAACALALSLILPGRMGVTGVCAVIAGTTALMIASDASLVMFYGEDFAAYVSALLSEIRELAAASLGGSSSVAAMAALDETMELLGKVWPCLYAARAAAVVAVGFVGLALARRDTCQRAYDAFMRYDVPLWCVGALVVAVACLCASVAGMAEVFGLIGLNLLLCLRVLFFLQGLAVGMDVTRRRRWRPVTRVLALTVMLLAELGFYAVSVFGVIDVWANFRQLARRSGARAAEAHGEGE